MWLKKDIIILIFPVFLSTFDDGLSKPLKLKEHNQEGRTFENLARSWWYDNTTTWELRNEDSFTAAAAAVKACAFPLGSLVEYWIFIGLSGGKTH